MNERNIKREVHLLWLQYFGLKTGSAGKYDWIENAARIPETQLLVEELPDIPGLVLAT